jgi:phosphatidylethanolamine/phosphatidyl-N-methylethanolamine N-methyltransferase
MGAVFAPSTSSPGAASPANAVERTYQRLAPVYDLVYGASLENGRLRAMEELRLCPGERVLEIGVGTGATLPLYPEGVSVAGIDMSAAMLERARGRLRAPSVVAEVSLLRMDAGRLAFPPSTFDLVFAAYVINAVGDPGTVVREMKRVCRPTGRIVFLNHFMSETQPWRLLERLATPVARGIGFRWDLPLADVIGPAGLTVELSVPVNIPPLSRLVVCRL